MILIVQRYDAGGEARNAELRRADEENVASGLFEHIEYLDGKSRRWTYADVFCLASERFDGQKCVLANSDISFRHYSCSLLQHLISPDRLIALTRWHDDATPWMVGLSVQSRWYSGTQDVWGFIGGRLVGLGDYPLGEPGCDCRMTAAAVDAGAAVWNPALTVRVMHIHDELNSIHRPSPNGRYGYAELTTAEKVGGVVIKNYPDLAIYEYEGANRARSE